MVTVVIGKKTYLVDERTASLINLLAEKSREWISKPKIKLAISWVDDSIWLESTDLVQIKASSQF